MARHHQPAAVPPVAPLAQKFLRPLERFLHVEAASGVALLLAAAVALLWANSPWSAAYERLWHAPLTLGIGGLVSVQSLHFWINDGLMTIFFLVVGLEIRRELHEGALASLRLAVLPFVAAAGGVLAPALIYLALSGDPALRSGWAVPTATDIAFAVGVLALLGRRVPGSLRVLLLALAIIDDIAAIAIIAIFYSSGVSGAGLLITACGVLGVLAFQRMGVQAALAYAIPGGIVWFGLLRAGVHPSLAGVILGLLTPVTVPSSREGLLASAGRALEDFRERLRGDERGARALIGPVQQLERAQRQLLPPVTRIETVLHPWVAYGVMPLFALANAGVRIDAAALEAALPAALGTAVFFGLLLGKPLGILLASWIAVRAGIAALPPSVTWRGILVVGCLGGIGFTMAIFIANLAFADQALLATAKLGVLAASGAAAVTGLLLGKLLLTRMTEDPQAERRA